MSLGSGSRVKKRKNTYGGISEFLIHVTEYFKNPKFQNRDFEKKHFFSGRGVRKPFIMAKIDY